MAQGKEHQNLKEIHALGSEIIATRTDAAQKSHTMTSADSQTELKIEIFALINDCSFEAFQSYW